MCVCVFRLLHCMHDVAKELMVMDVLCHVALRIGGEKKKKEKEHGFDTVCG